jgi:tRNA dimethylallyltransferase
MQVYRGMDIGTAKPTAAEQGRVPHHLIDLVGPDEDFTVSDYQAAARTVIADIESRGKRALLVGGTALHLRAVVDDLEIPGRYPDARAELEVEADTAALHQHLVEEDPVAAARMEPSNRRRVVRALEVTRGSGRPFSSFGPGLDEYPASPFRLVGLWLPRAVIRRRIEERYRAQMAAGFLDEVRDLSEGDAAPGRTAAQALGYRELLGHLAGTWSLDEALGRPHPPVRPSAADVVPSGSPHPLAGRGRGPDGPGRHRCPAGRALVTCSVAESRVGAGVAGATMPS